MLTFSINPKIEGFTRISWLQGADDTLDTEATNILAKAGYIKKSHKYSKPSCFLDSQLSCFNINNGVLKKIYTYTGDENFVEPSDDALLLGEDDQLVHFDRCVNVIDFFVMCDALFYDYGLDVWFLFERFFMYGTTHSEDVLLSALHLDLLSDFHLGVLLDCLSDSVALSKIIENINNTDLIDALHLEFVSISNNEPTLESHESISCTKIYRERFLSYM